MSNFSGFRFSRRALEHLVDWRHVLHRDGWSSFLKKVRQDARKLPRRKVEYIIMEVPLEHPFPNPPCLSFVEVRPFTSADLEFVRKEFLPSEAAMCARRLAAGHEGLIAVLDGEIAGCCWLCRDDSLERADLPIGTDEVLFTDAFTAPRFRGQGVNTSLALASLRRARQLHLRRLIGYIRTDNTASQAVWLGKLNGRVFAKLEFKRVWTGRRTRITNVHSKASRKNRKNETKGTFYVCYYRECFRRGLDAGRMTRYLVANGWQPVIQMAKADLVVVYTCGGFDFTEKRCYKTIRRALSRKKAPPRVRRACFRTD